jgi:DNA polymerase-3 subunit epsilon
MSTTAAASALPPVRQPVAVQASFDELGRPLREVTFCVVDLETTGGSAAGGSMITEVGAVKVRGGEVLGEFQTLVNPHVAIPPFIAVLTGITDSMVADSPGIASVLPAFWSSPPAASRGPQRAVRRGLPAPLRDPARPPWPEFDVVDTARLARRALTRDETPNCKLSTWRGTSAPAWSPTTGRCPTRGRRSRCCTG